jgi:hypothetical protein
MKRVIAGSIITGVISVFLLLDILGGYADILSLTAFGLLWYGLGASLLITGIRANRRKIEGADNAKK